MAVSMGAMSGSGRTDRGGDCDTGRERMMTALNSDAFAKPVSLWSGTLNLENGCPTELTGAEIVQRLVGIL